MKEHLIRRFKAYLLRRRGLSDAYDLVTCYRATPSVFAPFLLLHNVSALRPPNLFNADSMFQASDSLRKPSSPSSINAVAPTDFEVEHPLPRDGDENGGDGDGGDSGDSKHHTSSTPPWIPLRSRRSRTAPSGLDPVWTSLVDQPQLSERDSIFATTYLSDSPTSPLPIEPDTAVSPRDERDRAVSGPASPLPTSMAVHSRSSSHAYSRSLQQRHGGLASLPCSHGHSHHPVIHPADSPSRRVSPPHHPDSIPETTLPKTLPGEDLNHSVRRAWLEGKAVYGGLSGAKATQKFSNKGAHVDKKIEATLPLEETPSTARSRKASHYLRVFKENGAVESHGWKGSGPTERVDVDYALPVQQGDAQIAAPFSATTSALGNRRGYPESTSNDALSITWPSDNSSSHVASDPTLAEGHHARANAPTGQSLRLTARPSTESQNSFCLAEQGRNEHAIAPAVNTKSISAHVSSTIVEDIQGGSAAAKATPLNNRSLRLGIGDVVEQSASDDESEREQISSALYFPHPHISPQSASLPEPGEANADAHDIRTSIVGVAGEGSDGWPAEEITPTRQGVEISLQSQDTSQFLHGDLPASVSPQFEPDAQRFVVSPGEGPVSAESDYESIAESMQSVLGDEPSVLDDQGATSTVTLPHRRASKALAQPPAPVGAVELKPYDHQVGGHTTVYQFSRRAVCKQLNNRENEFYETVERHHPELLEFLPR